MTEFAIPSLWFCLQAENRPLFLRGLNCCFEVLRRTHPCRTHLWTFKRTIYQCTVTHRPVTTPCINTGRLMTGTRTISQRPRPYQRNAQSHRAVPDQLRPVQYARHPAPTPFSHPVEHKTNREVLIDISPDREAILKTASIEEIRKKLALNVTVLTE